jgi:putative ubiquitin-RnfH superfamily antitoxin RatB of RatAB toxin-antitoxin module
MNDPKTPKLAIEVAYATPTKQKIIALHVDVGCTAFDAAVQSGIAAEFDDVDLTAAKMGIFGKSVKPKEYELRAGDRVEIYRPLVADPKAARKARAEKSRQAAERPVAGN